MKTDIINTNYIYNHKLFKYWKIPALTYGAMLIYYTTDIGFEKLNNYESIFTIISNFFIGSSILLVLGNMFLFSRIGKLLIENNIITINLEDNKKTIDLNSVSQITLGKDQNKIYYLKILNDEIFIELDKTELTELKKTLENFNIVIKDRHFTDKISNWLNK